ncbi:MAG TPA: restriction endonuclease subunit S, partial [Agitococcus sp.]|nr:restriction endonuclease subunit S [Agitococcus sp.]
DNLERYLLKKGDLLMCMTDMKNNVALLGHTALMDIDNEFLLNQRVGMLRSKDASIVNYPFLYILTNSEVFIEDLRRRANSGVQVNLSTSEIKNTKFILPPKNIHQRFNEIVEATFGKLFLLEQQQDSLTEIRDTLLPRLISGQLRINQAQDLINEVGA